MRPFFWLGLTLLIGLAVISRGYSQQPCLNGNCGGTPDNFSSPDTYKPGPLHRVFAPIHRLGDHVNQKMDTCNCGSDGCPAPLGCSNFWTENKFFFGSCKQFFGTGNAAEGYSRRNTKVSP